MRIKMVILVATIRASLGHCGEARTSSSLCEDDYLTNKTPPIGLY
jgi:hypothetical protein